MASETRVNLILKGELAEAFLAEYYAEQDKAREEKLRAPSYAEVARMLVQDGLRQRGHTNVEDGVGDWGGWRGETKDDEEKRMLAVEAA